MIAQREFTRDFKDPKQVFPEFWDDLGRMIIDDVMWDAMIFEYFSYNKIFHVMTIKGLYTWKEICHLNEIVYHNENDIITLVESEICNEI